MGVNENSITYSLGCGRIIISYMLHNLLSPLTFYKPVYQPTSGFHMACHIISSGHVYTVKSTSAKR